MKTTRRSFLKFFAAAGVGVALPGWGVKLPEVPGSVVYDGVMTWFQTEGFGVLEAMTKLEQAEEMRYIYVLSPDRRRFDGGVASMVKAPDSKLGERAESACVGSSPTSSALCDGGPINEQFWWRDSDGGLLEYGERTLCSVCSLVVQGPGHPWPHAPVLPLRPPSKEEDFIPLLTFNTKTGETKIADGLEFVEPMCRGTN